MASASAIPFFSAQERREAGCWHQLFFAQVEYCENLIFRRRTALDELGERLHDANRMIGRPDKLTVIYGRRVTIGEAYLDGDISLEGDLLAAFDLRTRLTDSHTLAYLWSTYGQRLLFGQLNRDKRWIQEHYDCES